MNSPHNVKSLKIWTTGFFFLLSLFAVTVLSGLDNASLKDYIKWRINGNKDEFLEESE